MSDEKGQNFRKLQNHLSQQNSWNGNPKTKQNNAKKSLKSRSRKQNTSQQSLSFEKDLIRGHWKDFLEKCQKSLSESSKYGKIRKQEQNLSPSKTEKQLMMLQAIKKNPFFSSEIDAEQFLLDLHHEDKLCTFLYLIAHRIPLPLSSQLIFIAYQTWELYLGLKNDHQDEKQFFKISQEASQIFLTTSFPKLGMKDLKGMAKNESTLKQFVLNFCLRILAIIQGYFNTIFTTNNENPE